MTDSIVTEQVDTNERVFLETDKVKISSVSQPFPQVTGEDVDRVEENLKLNPYLENILEESYPAFCYGGYILKGKELIVSSKNSREVFYEHKDLLNDCYNSIPESESSLKTWLEYS